VAVDGVSSCDCNRGHIISFICVMDSGGRQSWLPAFPYGQAYLFKRSRSDVDKIALGPALSNILGNRLGIDSYEGSSRLFMICITTCNNCNKQSCQSSQYHVSALSLQARISSRLIEVVGPIIQLLSCMCYALNCYISGCDLSCLGKVYGWYWFWLDEGYQVTMVPIHNR
jgi:hypothetical protein